MRQARAKQQRAEAELRAAKQAAAAQAARVHDLESLNAKKDLQLDAAVQQAGGAGLAWGGGGPPALPASPCRHRQQRLPLACCCSSWACAQ